ncbi:MAG: GNAT family N-acetyltransferase, partial [Chloroflexota bacterium]
RALELAAADFTFAPLREQDLDRVRAWLLLPHVRRWYDDVAEDVFPDDTIAERRVAIRGDDPTDLFVIHLGGRPIGEIQSYRIEDHPEYAAMVALGRPAFGIDLYIGEPDLIGKGHGPALIRAFLRDVGFPRYGVDLCVIGPTRGNTAAIRAYEKAGFRFLKEYLEPDSREQEHYLMQLTRAEFDAAELY